MSGLWKPGSIVGTAVDPASPGGVLIEAPTEFSSTTAPAGSILQSDGNNWIVAAAPSASSFRYFIKLTISAGVPDNGVQYCQLGESVFSSQTGTMMPADGTITGIAFAADAQDTSRAFNVEVLTDPSGVGGSGPTVAATLPVPSSTLRTRIRSLAVPVAGLVDIGARVVRTSGSGASTFDEVVVLVEVSIP